MSKNNIPVDTAKNGQTTQDTEKKVKVPTGKVITAEEKEKRRKAREEQYKNFRIGALKRRAKRMGLSEEQTKVKVEELKKQLDTPNNYMILVMFNKNDCKMIKEMLLNENLTWKIMTDDYTLIEGDAEVLSTLRELMPKGAHICPYVKKKPAILPVAEAPKKHKNSLTKKQKKNNAHAAKLRRKASKKVPSTKNASNSGRCAAMRQWRKFKDSIKAAKKAHKKSKCKTIGMVNKKPSESLKKPSTSQEKATIKKAA